MRMYTYIKERFFETFGKQAAFIFSAPGRTERSAFSSISVTCAAVRVPLNLSGARMIFIKNSSCFV